MNKYAIGNNIHAVLKVRKMTQAQLAEAIGVNASNVSTWTSGKRMPSSYAVYKISKVLRVSMESIMDGIDGGE